eukprot:c3417_g1_i1.p1 GENE.c3417_g1_i1~~c3417_g1_i1.p1  ORF type:complete len:468 (-),score=209.45 c3417_g1_i1:27-1409(-)
MTQLNQTARDCVDFINSSPSPFHAVATSIKKLKENGFVQLSEKETWKLEKEKKYFFTRNRTTIVAFAIGGKFQAGNGFQIVAAHTDSPHPKVKPVSAIESQGFLEVGVELYGGGLWHTWFDRDLSIAGRVMKKTANGFESQLVNIDRPILRIPTLAIHLTGANERDSFAPNKEDHMTPVLATSIKGKLDTTSSSHHPLLLDLISKELKCDPKEIGDFELSLYDNHKGIIGGACEEFVFCARLDNLGSSFCSLQGLIEACNDTESLKNEDGVRMVCLFDHEECGSQSAQGAESSLLERTIIRVTSLFVNQNESNTEAQEKTFRNSFLISADMAHGVHPNYSAKHEGRHRPALHKGIVIKENANQRYATNSFSTSLIRYIANKFDVPLQEFVVRNDSPCGTTVGPILAAGTGIRTVDIGVPQLSMHSIREMCGVDDLHHYKNLFKGFFSTYQQANKAVVDEN